jgi:hypothetical protein
MVNTRDAIGAPLGDGPYTEAGRDAIREAQRLRDYADAAPAIRGSYGNSYPYLTATTAKTYNQELTKQLPMTALADRLHDQASSLDTIAQRLSAVLERLNGPVPTPAPAGENNPSQSGPGVLHVAQFGSQRIAMNIERLTAIAADLEQSI